MPFDNNTYEEQKKECRFNIHNGVITIDKYVKKHKEFLEQEDYEKCLAIEEVLQDFNYYITI